MLEDIIIYIHNANGPRVILKVGRKEGNCPPSNICSSTPVSQEIPSEEAQTDNFENLFGIISQIIRLIHKS